MTSWLALRAALHDLDLEEPMWVGALFAEGRGLLDAGLGLFAYSYRVAAGATIRLGSVAGTETAPDVWRALFAWGAENQSVLAPIYRTGAGSLEAWRLRAGQAGVALSEFPGAFEPQGVRDVFTIVGHDPAGFGVFLTAPQARRQPAQAPQERRAFERLAAELAAALRLRDHRRRQQTARLSAREEQVARCLLDGASDKSIAFQLGVAVSTVSTFTRRVRSKLGCRPGEELLVLAAPARRGNVLRRLALFERLTASECEIAAELLVGLSHADIAQRRGVSVRTVASQCAAVFRKCGVSGRRELASLLLSEQTSGK
jgi:DNA-binding NarL/FixJ family response regulator